MKIDVQGCGEVFRISARPPYRLLLIILILHGLLFLNAALAVSLLRRLPSTSRAFPGFAFFMALVLVGWLLLRYIRRYRLTRSSLEIRRGEYARWSVPGGGVEETPLEQVTHAEVRGGVDSGTLSLVFQVGEGELTVFQFHSSANLRMLRAESMLHAVLCSLEMETENSGVHFYSPLQKLSPAIRVKVEQRALMREGEFFLPVRNGGSLIVVPILLLLVSALCLGFSFILGWIAIFSGTARVLLTALSCGLLFFAGAVSGIAFMRRVSGLMRGLEAIRSGTNREGLYRLDEGWLLLEGEYVHFLPQPLVTEQLLAGRATLFSSCIRLKYTAWSNGFSERLLECRVAASGLRDAVVRGVVRGPGSEPNTRD